MKRLLSYLMLLSMGIVQQAIAGGAVRIADGDCAALSAAAAVPAGQEQLIVLARSGHYGICTLQVTGHVTVEGAGAHLALPALPFNDTSQISIASGAQLTVRNAVFGGDIAATKANAAAGRPKAGPYGGPPAIGNSGTLIFDSVSIHDEPYFGYGGASTATWNHFLGNTGNVILRNSTIKDIVDGNNGRMPYTGLLSGSVEITHSTIVIAQAWGNVFGNGAISIANSVVVNTGSPICNPSVAHEQFVSHGGNVLGDSSCSFSAPNDKVVGDPRVLDFALHGGVIPTLALNYDSPAIGNGVVANCEATDARGLARGQNACDSGAYEVGGGDGKLSQTGMSGLYFNAANNGHYVSIQKLYGDQSLVIWNTFDEHGVPAWLYGVGHITGNRIHVEQVAQNVGGTLHAGGGVTGSTPTLWGTLDVDLSDCYNASLSYDSLFPNFGSGSTTLQRLVFLDGVNCAR